MSNLEEISFTLRTTTGQGDPVGLSHSGTACISWYIMVADQSAHVASTLAMIDIGKIALDNSEVIWVTGG